MTQHRNLNGQSIPALGFGCWAIGGPFFSGETPLGWGDVDDAVSIRAIDAAVDLGIRFFDTAQAYGTGHSETVLGKALKARPDVMIGTKIGYGIDSATRQLTGEVLEPTQLALSIEHSRQRLQRDKIDLIHLHLNECSIENARPIFELMESLRESNIIGAFGWSTDFPDRTEAFANMPGFASIQHAMNVFFRAEKLMPVIEANNLLSINRSPLAMGLLGGKHSAATQFSSAEIRGQNAAWMAYFENGRIKPAYAKRLDAIRDELQRGGRTLAQGAICWLWARSQATLPIPGFRTEAQVKDLVGALQFGPHDAATMTEIERLIDRESEGPARSR